VAKLDLQQFQKEARIDDKRSEAAMEKKENNKDILEYQLKDFKDLKKDLR
jgi:hypothetical protein